MKKLYLFLIILFAFSLVGCTKTDNKEKDREPDTTDTDNNTGDKTTDPTGDNENPINQDGPIDEPIIKDPNHDPNEDEPKDESITWLDQKIYVALGDSYRLNLEIEGDVNYEFEYEEDVLEIKDDTVYPKAISTSSISLSVNNEKIKSVEVVVYEKLVEIIFDLPESMYVGDRVELKANTNFLRVVSTSDCISYDIETNTIIALTPGSAVIVCQYVYDKSVSGAAIITINEKLEEATDYLVTDKVYANGEKVTIDSKNYYYGENLFSTISDALTKTNEVNIDSTTEDSLQINTNGVKLTGVNPSQELNIKITLSEGVSDVLIYNLTFVKDSTITLSGGNSKIIINGNRFMKTTVNNEAWKATKDYTFGIITLENSSKYHDEIYIENNTFTDIGDCGVNASTVHNIACNNNTFDGFSKDAIRMNNGIVRKECTWNFNNNTFKNGKYSGLYFRTYGTDAADIYHFVNIKDNIFDNVAQTNTEFCASICFRNYQEGCTCVDIAYNSFANSSKFIFLRNNAVEKNQVNFNGYVTDNVFKTIPSTYYFNNLNSSDSFKLNPKQTVLLDNVYLDGNGVDYTPDASKFIGCALSTQISSKDYESYAKIYLSHIMFLGTNYNIGNLKPTDYDYFNYICSSATPIVEGITYLFDGDTQFEVKCVKRVELVVKFINIALGEVGYEEMDAEGNTGTSGNYTKYGEWYGINPGAWCAMFVSWCANQAGVSTTVIPKYASVSIGMEWYKERGLFKYKEEYTPKAGDIMFMKSNGASHTGIVLYCDGKTLWTVEGNSSDKCALRKYDVNNAKITGYGTPEWSYYSKDGYDFSNGEAQDGSGHSTI